MKIASALACAALVSIPVLALALPSPDGLIQPPPGWIPQTPKRHAASSREWRRGYQFLGIDVRGSTGTLRSEVDRVVVPASNIGGSHVVSSAPLTLCHGQPGWLVVSTMPTEPGQHAVIEAIVAVDRPVLLRRVVLPPVDEPSRPEAERAIRSLCLKPN